MRKAIGVHCTGRDETSHNVAWVSNPCASGTPQASAVPSRRQQERSVLYERRLQSAGAMERTQIRGGAALGSRVNTPHPAPLYRGVDCPSARPDAHRNAYSVSKSSKIPLNIHIRTKSARPSEPR